MLAMRPAPPASPHHQTARPVPQARTSTGQPALQLAPQKDSIQILEQAPAARATSAVKPAAEASPQSVSPVLRNLLYGVGSANLVPR
jgi:hypothetical protein